MGGFNSFLADQQKVGDNAAISVFKFGTNFETIYEDVAIEDATELTEAEYSADGGRTALLDAIGKTVASLKGKIAKQTEEDRADKVIVLVMTDGFENQSTEFKTADIKSMIGRQEGEGWQFIYLGADMSGVSDASNMGFSPTSTMKYAPTKSGTKSVHNAMSKGLTGYRGMSRESRDELTAGTIDLFSAEVRAEADDKSTDMVEE